jgi:hypothetical protein
MAKEPAHFTLTEGGGFMPTAFAQSHWGDDHLNGPAVVGLAARALENHCGSPDFVPTRLTADLFRPARGVLTTIDVRVVRDGRRRPQRGMRCRAGRSCRGACDPGAVSAL